jgi:D-xylose transport system permease protein
MLMVMAEIDLSIGSAIFLTGVVAAKLQIGFGVATLPAVLAAVATGMVLGAWQGFWTVRLGVPSFVVTLAGLLAFRGIGLLWTNAATLSPFQPPYVDLTEAFVPATVADVALGAVLLLGVFVVVQRRRFDRSQGLPASGESAIGQILITALLCGFVAWISTGFLGMPTALIWVAGVGVALWLIMMRTTFGRNAYLIGSNREAARLSGVDVKRQVFLGFVLMGVIYGIGGVLLTARVGSSLPSLGQNMELDAIAAAVIGGTSLAGGVGTIPGAMAGALLLATIDNGTSLANVSSFAQDVVKGMVLLLALAMDAYAMRKRGRGLRALLHS